MDGGAVSGSVTGFENVDLAGYTGGGASVTAVKTGSTMTGTACNRTALLVVLEAIRLTAALELQ